MKKGFLPVIWVVFATTLFGYDLRFNLPLGAVIESEKTANVEYYENSELRDRYQERDVIQLRVYTVESNGVQVQGTFDIFRKSQSDYRFSHIQRFESDFFMGAKGYYVVLPRYDMPNVKHVPSFPDDDVTVGSSWTKPVVETIISLNPRLNMMLVADYHFVDVETWNGTNVAVINFHYVIDKDLTKKRVPATYPTKIYGYSYGTFYWDLDANIPIASDEQYQILFVGGDNRTGYASASYRMLIHTDYRIRYPETNRITVVPTEETNTVVIIPEEPTNTVVVRNDKKGEDDRPPRPINPVRPPEKDDDRIVRNDKKPEKDKGEKDDKRPKPTRKERIRTEKEKIDKVLPKDKGITTVVDEKGVILRLGDILFDFDSATIRRDAQTTIDEVVTLLRQHYPNADILVEGHTDSVGDDKYNETLSRKRSKAVAAYMKRRLPNNTILFLGYGESRPIANNRTASGRQQNRRVDIVIRMK